MANGSTTPTAAPAAGSGRPRALVGTTADGEFLPAVRSCGRLFVPVSVGGAVWSLPGRVGSGG